MYNVNSKAQYFTSTSIWALMMALISPACRPALARFIVGTEAGKYLTKINFGLRETKFPKCMLYVRI